MFSTITFAACDNCYNSIDSQYASLAESNSNITKYVEMLVSQDIALNVGPFVDRLTSIQTILLDLVARVRLFCNILFSIQLCWCHGIKHIFILLRLPNSYGVEKVDYQIRHCRLFI